MGTTRRRRTEAPRRTRRAEAESGGTVTKAPSAQPERQARGRSKPYVGEVGGDTTADDGRPSRVRRQGRRGAARPTACVDVNHPGYPPPFSKSTQDVGLAAARRSVVALARRVLPPSGVRRSMWCAAERGLASGGRVVMVGGAQGEA